MLRLIALLLLLEVAIWRCLARWAAHRPDVPGGAVALGYARMIGPVLWLWIIASGAEVAVVELILRSIDAGWADAIRAPVLILGIWGLLWMLGLLASYRVRPHLLLSDRLLIRQGPRAAVDVPFRLIASQRPAEHDAPNGLRTIHQRDEVLLVPVNGRTNIELRLAEATPVMTSSGPRVATQVAFWADDPGEAARLLGARGRPAPAG